MITKASSVSDIRPHGAQEKVYIAKVILVRGNSICDRSASDKASMDQGVHLQTLWDIRVSEAKDLSRLGHIV